MWRWARRRALLSLPALLACGSLAARACGGGHGARLRELVTEAEHRRAGMAGAAPSPEDAAAAFSKVHPREYYERFLAKRVRPDGRGLQETRPTSITRGAVGSADGSAMVQVGSTTVMGTVRAEVTTAAADAPNAGRLAVNFVVTALASPNVRPGRPNDAAAAMSHTLERIIASSEAVKVEDLVIVEGDRQVWVLFCDLYCLDYDGNVMDAALMALLASLQDTKLPVLEPGPADQLVVSAAPPRPLTLQHIPVALTLAVIDKHVVADPTQQEESLGGSADVDAALLGGSAVEAACTSDNFSIVIGDNDALCGIYKPGGTPLSDDQVRESVALARQRACEVRQMLSDAAA